MLANYLSGWILRNKHLQVLLHESYIAHILLHFHKAFFIFDN
jgi:hypothetical protein